MIYAIIFLTIILLGIIFSKLSTKLLIDYFNKHNNFFADINKTSCELLSFFIKELKLNVKLIEYSNFLDNSYNIKQKLILLSKDIINNKSVPALAISMHELGHALQHKNKNKLFNLNHFFMFLNKVTSFLLLPLILFLIVSLFLSSLYLNLALILVLCFYLINLIIRIIIIPLEKNASKIALNLLSEYKIFDEDEMKISKRLLNLALLTYVGGFFSNYTKLFKKIIKNF